jgi:hypothetical protein
LGMRSALYLIGLAAAALVMVTTLFCAGDDQPGRSEEVERRLERLRSVPYTSVTPEKVSAETTGVTVFDRGRAWPGYNLFCSRIAPEALLLDMDGNVVHRWSHEQEDYKLWDHAVLLANGDLIVLNKFKYIFKLHWNSDLVWEKKLAVHHEIAEAEDGTLFVIEYSVAEHRGLNVRFANILHLDADGNELGRWSTYEHLDDLKRALDRASFLDTTLDLREAHGGRRGRMDGARELTFDYFHLNTITVLPETPLGSVDSRFAAGNLLICLRNVNQLATICWETGDVLWGWGEGVLEWPHHPTMLANGNILVFDNGVVREYSRVLEIDPVSEAVVWEYMADPPEAFFTPQKGSSQRLTNGNTLICEGDRGRVFEVTRSGETVWEWYNPLMEEGRRVQVYRMMRYPADMVEPLLGH